MLSCHFICMYSYVIRMSVECTRMSSLCHSCVLVYNDISLAYTRMSSVCHSYILACHRCVTRMYSFVIRMPVVCTRMSSLCHTYLLICHLMSLVFTRMSCVCHSYVLKCHPYVPRMWFYHEP